MNTNFLMMRVIQDEKVKEYQEFSDQVRVISMISNKGRKTRDYQSMLVEKLQQLRVWFTCEIRSLRFSYR
jgi:hypothetical protein